jgi:hypothetical protein
MTTTENELNGNNSLKKATTKAKKLRGFYSNLRSYLIVNLLFLIINWVSFSGEWWVLIPATGWGFFLILHALDVFAPLNIFNDEWEERKTRELTDKYNGI